MERGKLFVGKKLTNEEFLKRLKEKVPTLEPLEKYIKSDISIKFKCNICNTEFYNSPIHILGSRRQGCPTCYHNRQKPQKKILKIAQKRTI